MKRVFRTKTIAALLGTAALVAQAHAAPHGVKVGSLTCHVESGWGYVLGSSKELHCNFQPNEGEPDRYVGSMSKLGVDIGYTSSGTIVWEVIAPSSDVRAGALQGDYAGATASATVGAGVGAHVLVGGFDKSIALQPVSFEGNTGLDVAAGIGAMSLTKEAHIPAAERREERTEVAPPQRLAEAAPPPAAPVRDEAPPVHRTHYVHRHHHRTYCRPQ